MSYGYRLIDGRMTVGASLPSGGFLPQVCNMQPAGHWVMADGSLVAGPAVRLPFASPGPITRWLALHLHGQTWVQYSECSKPLPWV